MNLAISRGTLVVLIVLLVVTVVGMVGVLSYLGAFEPRVKRLTRQLQTAEKPEERAAAAKELGRMGADARPAIPALVKALNDDGWYVTAELLFFRQEHFVFIDAADSLKKIGGKETAEAVIAETLAIKRGERQEGWRPGPLRMEVLAHLGREARPVAGRLLEVIDEDGRLIAEALDALQAMELAPGTPEEVACAKKVLPQFCNWGHGVGVKAAWLLHRMAPDDDDVLELYVRSVVAAQPPVGPGMLELNARTLPLLIQHLEDEPNLGAVNQLKLADLAALLPALTESLHDPQPRIREGAATVLADRGPAAAEALPDLAPLLEDANRSVQVAAAIALWRIGQQADTTFPVIVAALASGDSAARDAARTFLDTISSADNWATAALAKTATSAEAKTLRIEALLALGRLGPTAAEALPEVLTLLKADDPDVQRAAAKTLAAIDTK